MTETCSECGTEHESLDEFEVESIREFSRASDGSISVHGNRDLFMCKGCKKSMGVGVRENE